MTEKEKENRIHSFALSFLERQQIIPNLYADQIIRGYKEGYHQAEKDLKVKEVDLDESARYYLLHEHISPLNEVLHQADLKVEMQYHKDIEDAYKAGFELGLKAQKGQ